MKNNRDKQFYKKIIYDLAENLAQVENAHWDKVNVIFSLCPKVNKNDVFEIHQFSLDSLIALGVYFIKSGLQHADKIISYLLQLLEGLAEAKWPKEENFSQSPFPEKFSFSLNLLLSDISVKSGLEMIVSHQLTALASIFTEVEAKLTSNDTSQEVAQHLFYIKIPIFIGLMQSMGRYHQEKTSIFCHLFPAHTACIGVKHYIKMYYDITCSKICYCKKTVEPNKHTCKGRCYSLSDYQLEQLISVAESLLSVGTLESIENMSSLVRKREFINEHHFFYKDLNEVLKFSAVYMLTEVLCYQINVSPERLIHVQNFTEDFYFVRQHGRLAKIGIEKDETMIRKFGIDVIINAMCIKLLVWSSRDAVSGEILINHIKKGLSSVNNPNRFLITNAPLIVACLEGLGMLADKYPELSNICVSSLNKFLTCPSQSLINLNSIRIQAAGDDLKAAASRANEFNRNLIEDSVFRTIQNTSIENMCIALKAANTSDLNYIPAFLTSLSHILFAEQGKSSYDNLVVQNVIITLSQISIKQPDFTSSIIQFFYHRLRRHSIISDITIIKQLGNMLISIQNDDVFIHVAKIFYKLIAEISEDSIRKEHISYTVYEVLETCAYSLEDTFKIEEIFIRLLELFTQSGLDEFRSSDIVIYAKWPHKKFHQEKLLAILSILAKRLPTKDKSPFRQFRLFQEFWFYIVLIKDTSSFVGDWMNYLKCIAPKLPTLTSDTITDHDLQEYFYVSIVNTEKLMPRFHLLKSRLLQYVQNNMEVAAVINRLTFSQIIYLHSVYNLEIIRIENSAEISLEPAFSYILNNKLQKNRSGIWQTVCKILEQVFSTFLSKMLKKHRNDEREKILEKHVEFLLIQFNNIHPQVRHISDKLLTKLIDTFPHLLWNYNIMRCILDIITTLSNSIDTDFDNNIRCVSIPNTNYTISLIESTKFREQIFNDFVARSRQIVAEANKWAPEITLSHLEEYLLETKAENASLPKRGFLKNDDSILAYLNCSSVKFDMSEIISSLSMRSRFLGEIKGISEISFKQGINKNDLQNNLVVSIWSACKESNLTKYQSSMVKTTAFAISEPVISWEVRHAIARSHVSYFTVDTMQTAIYCWNWLKSARPDLECDLLQEILNAWQLTVTKRIGLYSEDKLENSYIFSPSFGKTDTNPSCLKPHCMWANYISQHSENAKYCNQDQLEMLVSFYHNTFPMTVGNSDCLMSKNVETVTARFCLLNSALSLIQADVLLTTFNKIMLRGRIYSNCLDYFCGPQKFPAEGSNFLKSTIETLIKFWNCLYSDKRYFVNEFWRAGKTGLETSSDSVVSSRPRRTSVNSCMSERSSLLADNRLLEDNIFLSEFSFNESFAKKRKLALCLVASEIEFLATWYNPSEKSELKFIGEDTIAAWQSEVIINEKNVKDLVEFAWQVSPLLTVFLPARLKLENVFILVSKLIQVNPSLVSHIPDVVDLFVTPEYLSKEDESLELILTWAPTTPVKALSFFSEKYKPHPITLQYAARTLLSCEDDVLAFYIPQLIQSLHHDVYGYVSELIKAIARKSQLVCHQAIWNLKANMFYDINLTRKTPLHDVLERILNEIIGELSGAEKIFYEREFNFVDQITNVSSQIPKNLKVHERKRACLKALRDLKIIPGCYLPSKPGNMILEVDYNSGVPLQSKAKTPYLAKFLIADCGFSKMNDLALEISEQQMNGVPIEDIKLDDSLMGEKVWESTIFKAGDDVRQDILALQIIRIFKNIFDFVGLELFVHPYNVTAIAPEMGVIECIPNAVSRDQLGKQTAVGLYDYFRQTFGDETSVQFQNARRNFIQSVAAYSVIGFLLQIKDRHNGNIMVDKHGHIIHIDFGFMFENSPGGNLGFEPDFKLTEEMVLIMGGKMEAEPFQKFIDLCIKAFLAIRPYQEEIISLVSLMLNSGLPCFRGQTIKLLRGRFVPNVNEREAATYMMSVIRRSFLNFRTVTYDMIQYFQNSIKY